MKRRPIVALLVRGGIVLGVTGAAWCATGSRDWISELGGKVRRDPAGNPVAVNLRGTWVYDSQLIELARMPRLEELDLSHTRISDEGMLYLKTAPRITSLNVFYAEQVTDQGLNAIKDWKYLKRLNLRGTRISDGALEVVSRLTQLEALNIANTQITDNGLDNLISLVNLKELTLGRRRDSDNEIELLRLLPTLTFLNLGGPAGPERPDVTSRRDAIRASPMRAELAHAIAELKDLRDLKLGYSGVGADGLRAMAVLGRVERLGLEGCRNIDDAAASELLAWKNLKYLDLQETRVTEKGVAALRKAKPGIVILGPATAFNTDTSLTPAKGAR